MTRTLEVISLPVETLDARPLAALWNESYGDDLALTPAAIAWCAQADHLRSTFVAQVADGGQAIGFAIASALHGNSCGWIEAIALARGGRRRAVRAALVDAAAAWLRGQRCNRVALGEGPRALLRGSLPAPAQVHAWTALGFAPSTLGKVVDLALDITRYTPPPPPDSKVGVVRTATPRDRETVFALLEMAAALRSTASGGAPVAGEIEAIQAVASSEGRIADLMLLWTPYGLLGLAQIVFADSAIPIETLYPYRLARQWSALRSLVVDISLLESAGESAHELLADAALRRLHSAGVNSCIAPAVSSTSLYERYGFRAYRRWQPVVKEIG